MRIWVYTATFNEGYFVKHFLCAYKDAERIVVYDNMSTDNTVKLLRKDSRVEIRPFNTNNQLRNDMLLDIKNHSWKEARGKADWVIVVDFDEIFNRCRMDGSVETFDLDLSHAQEGGFNIIKPFGYTMISMDAPLGKDGHPYNYVRRALYHTPEEKMVCFKPDEIFEMRYFCGAHDCAPLDMNQTTNGIKVCIYNEYKNMHFKLWNYDYYIERIRLLRSRQSEFNRGMGVGWHFDQDDKYHSDMFLRAWKLSRPLFSLKRPDQPL